VVHLLLTQVVAVQVEILLLALAVQVAVVQVLIRQVLTQLLEQ
jgi:hypothetical protein